MNVQLLACDSINFVETSKRHHLGEVLNSITVPTLPFFLNLSIFVKILNLPVDELLDLSVRVIDSENNLLSYIGNYSIRNYRQPDQVPGIDVHFDVGFPLTVLGDIKIIAHIDEDEYASYPINIKLAR